MSVNTVRQELFLKYLKSAGKKKKKRSICLILTVFFTGALHMAEGMSWRIRNKGLNIK